MRLELTPSLAMKLGSLVVHADESSGHDGHRFDVVAMRSIVDDPEVTEWLDDFGPGLLPVKREAPKKGTPDDEWP